MKDNVVESDGVDEGLTEQLAEKFDPKPLDPMKVKVKLVRAMQDKTDEQRLSFLEAEDACDEEDSQTETLSDRALDVVLALKELGEQSPNVADALTPILSALMGEELSLGLADVTDDVEYLVGALVVPVEECDDHTYDLEVPVLVVGMQENVMGTKYVGLTNGFKTGSFLPWSDLSCVRVATPEEVSDFVDSLEAPHSDALWAKVVGMLQLACMHYDFKYVDFVVDALDESDDEA